MRAEFNTEKELLKAELTRSPHMKHLTFDLWTSPNQYAIVGVTVHFVDHMQQLQTQLLGLKRIYGTHGGENIGLVYRSLPVNLA